MSEPEQCIICLDPLPVPSSLDSGDAATTPDVSEETAEDNSYLNIIASLDGCEHIIHDACIRSWAQKTNTCPICRNPFHSVRVYNGVDGTAVTTYTVQDKKQVAEFDVQQWLGDNPEEEEEETNPCPICNSAEREDILLLCDSCDAAYHTHCIGLDHIPDGDWYCMECAHLFQLTQESESFESEDRATRPRTVRRPGSRHSRGFHARTRARLRRARRQARNAEWQGPWGQFSGRFYEMSDLDLDNHDDEDEDLEHFRRFQQLDRHELRRWQQRMNIAQRLGARETFVNNIPPQISEHLQNAPPAVPTPPPVVETRDERRAWGALEAARDSEASPSTTTRKRKIRSTTASPIEPAQEPERKLKRPRTRRLPIHAEASTSASSPATAGPSSNSAANATAAPTTATAASTAAAATAATAAARPVNGATAPRAELPNGAPGPALVSALLKELEPSGNSEDENGISVIPIRPAVDPSSPAISPSPSNHSSPRALSLTPPPLPRLNGRPTSPTLSLSTHIEPMYPPANYSPTSYSPTSYSPNRYSSDHSDSESRPSKNGNGTEELRQPRPRRAHQIPSRAEDSSPTRAVMTHEEKRNINAIVKNALRPHWRAQKLTVEQYATINRDISRRLYDEVKDATSLDDESKRSWEKRATQEVAQAVAELSA